MNTDQVQNIDNEPELVRRAQNGDKQAFSLLVKQYESMVYGFAFKVCRNEEKAAETLQDTFVNVYRKLDQFNGKAKFSTWLYQIVTNNCLMKEGGANWMSLLFRSIHLKMEPKIRSARAKEHLCMRLFR